LNFDIKDSGKHTLVVADPENLIKSAPIVGTAKIAPVLYEVIEIQMIFEETFIVTFHNHRFMQFVIGKL